MSSSLNMKTLSKSVTMKNDDDKICKITVGRQSSIACSPGKVLMLLGETGSGKSAFVDRLVNYLMEVKHEDQDRYKLIDEPEREPAQSQTKWITAYTFNQEDYPVLPYTFTIIDTPGYGDTEGLERDKKITEQIKQFFSIEGPQGFDHLEGVGLVVSAATCRITKTQIYIFDSVLSIFGNDFVNSVYLIITHSDGSDPPQVLKVVECKAEISYQEYFLFNSQLQGSPVIHKFFWLIAEQSFDQFFAAFSRANSVSLVLAKRVLKEREALNEALLNIRKKIDLGVNKINQLRKEKETLKTLKKSLKESKDLPYTVPVVKKRQIKLKKGYFVTNCKKCKVTCHYPCIVGDGNKSRCCVITKNGYCSFCSNDRCHWSKHENSAFRFELYETTETRTIGDLGRRYKLSGEVDEKEGMIKCLNEKIDENKKAVVSFIHKVGSAITRLNEIALKPIHLSEEDYINMLIHDEKTEGKPGFLDRIKSLEMVKDEVVILKNLDTEEKRKEHLHKLKKTSNECLDECLLDLKA